MDPCITLSNRLFDFGADLGDDLEPSILTGFLPLRDRGSWISWLAGGLWSLSASICKCFSFTSL